MNDKQVVGDKLILNYWIGSVLSFHVTFNVVYLSHIKRCHILCNQLNVQFVNSKPLVDFCAATRETAFVHAISAAGVAHAVTRACSTGRLDRCGCDRSIETGSGGPSSGPKTLTSSGTGAPSGSKSKSFQWAGCSDNVAYGTAFSKSFVDARETRAKGRDGAKTLMNLHNNNAGRKVDFY